MPDEARRTDLGRLADGHVMAGGRQSGKTTAMYQEILRQLANVERSRTVLICHPDEADRIRAALDRVAAENPSLLPPIVYASPAATPGAACAFPRRALCPVPGTGRDGPCHLCPATGACEDLTTGTWPGDADRLDDRCSPVTDSPGAPTAPAPHPAQRTAATLARIEAALHRRGWDQRPLLYAAYHLDDGSADNTTTWPGQPELIVADDMQLISMIPNVGLWDLFREPYTLLASLNKGFAVDDELRGFLKVLAEPGFAGVLFAAEAHEVVDKPNLRARFKGPLKDHPAAFEIRMIVFLGADGCTYMCTRERPTDKIVVTWLHPDGASNDPATAGGLSPRRIGKRLPVMLHSLASHILRELGEPPPPLVPESDL